MHRGVDGIVMYNVRNLQVAASVYQSSLGSGENICQDFNIVSCHVCGGGREAGHRIVHTL